jgi:hypothetical protein
MLDSLFAERPQLPIETLNLSPWNSLSDLLDAAEGSERARRRCEALRRDWQLKNRILEYLQRGMLIGWLDDHADMQQRIIHRYAQPPDATRPTKSGQQPNEGRVAPIMREWFLDIAHVIKEDQEADTRACAAPDRVEISLNDLPRRSSVMFHSPSGVDILINFRGAPPDRSIIMWPPDRVALYLPDTPEQWRPEYVEAMRGWSVVVFPLNTEASWRHARAIALKLQGVAASTRLIDMRNLRADIQNDLAACELWGFWLCRCQHGHWTIGDEHFRNDCKRHQYEKRRADLSTYQAHKTK